MADLLLGRARPAAEMDLGQRLALEVAGGDRGAAGLHDLIAIAPAGAADRQIVGVGRAGDGRGRNLGEPSFGSS